MRKNIANAAFLLFSAAIDDQVAINNNSWKQSNLTVKTGRTLFGNQVKVHHEMYRKKFRASGIYISATVSSPDTKTVNIINIKMLTEYL